MYKYSPFKSQRSIRLLALDGCGLDDDKIICSLEEFELEDLPPYAALSYTWGCPYANPNFELNDPSESAAFNGRYTAERIVPITCNGAKLFITLNLYEALQHIKRRYLGVPGSLASTSETVTESSYIWIDAICINQDNLAERSSQVAIMKLIYSSATKVLFWLGDWLPKTHRAVELIEYLATIPVAQWTSMKHRSLYSEKTYEELNMRNIDIEDWRILTSFLERNWFRRVWIIQEFCTSEFAIFLCGQRTIRWVDIFPVSELLKFTKWSWQLYNADLNSLSGDINWAQAKPFSGIYPVLAPEALQQFKETFWESERNDSNRESTGEEDIVSLTAIIHLSRAFAATDPRDRVFALLPVINRYLQRKTQMEDIYPDYKKKVEAVFVNITFCAMQAGRSLESLSLVCDPFFRKLTELPSWALDLTTLMYPNRLGGYGKWSATGDLPFKVPRMEMFQMLHLQGACIDTITDSTCQYLSFETGQVSSWLGLAMKLNMPYCNRQGRTEILWRTLVMDTAAEIRPAPEALGLHFPNYLLLRLAMPRNTSEVDHTSAERDRWVSLGLESIRALKHANPTGVMPSEDKLSMLWENINNEEKWKRMIFRSGLVFEEESHLPNGFRRLFLTNGNLLGLGPQSLERGDTVWLLPGGRVPIILRQRENGHYVVIGEAYVHGIMHGEAVEAAITDLKDIVLE